MFKSKIAIAAAALMATTVTASAGMDCNAQYSNFFEKLREDGANSISAAILAEVNRQGVRAYDACQAGDEQTAEAFFAQLREDGAAKSYFEKLQEDGASKK